MAKIYSFKTGKQISNGNKLKLKEYSLKITYECPKGHKFAEEYYSDKIMHFGVEECLKHSLNENENKYCPDCNEIVQIGKRDKKEPK